MTAARRSRKAKSEPQPGRFKVAVIGGGAAGLSAGYELSKAGAEVAVFERAGRLGGLASSFEFEGGALERYYHFLCLADYAYFALLEELGLKHKLHWRLTRMGQYHNGRLYSLGAPWDVLTFNPLSLFDRLRFGFGVLATKREPPHAWRDIEDQTVEEWLLGRFGRPTYEALHKPLVELKFGDRAKNLSAAWMWARINRLGKSRTRFLQLEKLGYLEGGTETLFAELASRIQAHGGQVHTGAPIDEVRVEDGRATAVVCRGKAEKFDAVLSTIPTPYLPDLVKGPYAERLAGLRRIESIGVVCVLLRLKRQFSPYFWTNVSDPRFGIAGIIEYTNLNRERCPNGDSLVYIPQYLPSDSPRYMMEDQKLLDEYVGYLAMLQKGFDKSLVRESWVFRDRYAQPICRVGFTAEMAGIASPIDNLYLTDSHQLFPDDRTIGNSIGLGKKAARLIARQQAVERDRAGAPA